MHVEIGELSSRIRTVDDSSTLSPRTLERIVQMVLEAINDRDRSQNRLRAERDVHGEADASDGMV
jgi:hypothetical protein